MTIKDRQKVNDYLPDDFSEKDPGEATPKGGLWQLVRKFGFGFNLTLGVALACQVFVIVFMALKGLKTVPLLADTFPVDHTRQFFTNTAAIALAAILQSLLLAEIFLAIRLRPNAYDTPLDLDELFTPDMHTETDQTRPPHSNIWWGVVLAALVVTVALDFGLLFLSLTGKSTLSAAWQSYQATPTLGFLFLPVGILDLLTLFCGAVLIQIASTKASDDEDGFKAFAEAFLVGAGSRLRAKVVKVWRKLGVDPLRFIPVNASTLKLLASKHPELEPPRSNADHWAYDFNGNMFALLPGDVHRALLQNIYRLGRDGEDIFDTDGTRLLWRQTASDTADMIARNIEIYGPPRFVDISNPNKPKILGSFGDLDAHPASPGKPLARLTAPGQNRAEVVIEPLMASQYLSPNLAFAFGLTPAERALFASYLTNTVFPYARGTRYPSDLPDLSIFEAFELENMLWYYRYWKKQAGSRA